MLCIIDEDCKIVTLSTSLLICLPQTIFFYLYFINCNQWKSGGNVQLDRITRTTKGPKNLMELSGFRFTGVRVIPVQLYYCFPALTMCNACTEHPHLMGFSGLFYSMIMRTYSKCSASWERIDFWNGSSRIT